MKFYTIFIYTLFSILLIHCSKDSQSSGNTIIDATVADEDGNVIDSAVIGIFKSYSDAYDMANQIGSSHITDSTGKINFTTDQSGEVYLVARKMSTCQTNLVNLFNFRNKYTLIENETNRCFIIAGSTGEMQFHNESNNTFRLFIDGVQIKDVAGSGYYLQKNFYEAEHTIRVLQLDGIISSPIDQTYTETILKCQSKTSSFPK